MISKQTTMAVPVAAEGVESSVAAAGPVVSVVDRGLAAQLVGEAQRRGLPVDGEGGLLAELTRLVLESALEGEITDHLGYDKHEKGGSVDRAAAAELVAISPSGGAPAEADLSFSAADLLTAWQ